MLQQATDDVEEDILQVPPGEVTGWHWPPTVMILRHIQPQETALRKRWEQFLLRKLSDPLGLVYEVFRFVYFSRSLSLSFFRSHFSCAKIQYQSVYSLGVTDHRYVTIIYWVPFPTWHERQAMEHDMSPPLRRLSGATWKVHLALRRMAQVFSSSAWGPRQPRVRQVHAQIHYLASNFVWNLRKLRPLGASPHSQGTRPHNFL